MRTLLAVLMVVLSFSANATYWQCDPLQDHLRLSDEQMYVMWQSYNYGKDEGFGYDLAAIAFKESSAGNALYNWNDPSAGVHHVLATHVLNDMRVPHTQENIAMAMHLLADNFEISASIGLRELVWWYNRHNGDRFLAYRSYNQGHFWRVAPENRVRSWNYAVDIRNMVNVMQNNNCWS